MVTPAGRALVWASMRLMNMAIWARVTVPVGGEPGPRRAVGDSQLEQGLYGIVGAVGELLDVEELIVVGLHVVDVDTALAHGSYIEEPGQELDHLPAGDDVVQRECPAGRALGYLQFDQLG